LEIVSDQNTMTTRSAPHIASVPTNIISGFLGVGKTTAIQNLLNQKPKHERWAVLVNEFGEVGIDTSLIETQSSTDTDIFLKEVPGGCMCCTNGLPMQMALNQLLSRARPHRLIIEPTGLGHLEEVIATLSSGFNQKTIRLNAVITLADARMLTQDRYLKNETFIEQVAVADIVIGNKCDLYHLGDKERLVEFASHQCEPETQVVFSERGVFDLGLLDCPSRFVQTDPTDQPHHHSIEKQLNDQLIPESGYLTASNAGDGYMSLGFRFDARFLFDATKVRAILQGINIERFKGVFKTQDGAKVFNLASDVLTEMSVPHCEESRCEAIGMDLPDDLTDQLLNAVTASKLL